MADGRVLEPFPSLSEIRERFQEEFGRLDERYKAIRHPDTYPVHLSPGLQVLKERVERQVETIEIDLDRHRQKDLGES
jgi:hypothetical protein